MSDVKVRVKFVYAPFLKMAFRPAGMDGWIWTGTLEENSEIKIQPMYAKRGRNKRFLGCWIEVTALDIECTAESRAKFLPYINLDVQASFLCGSGGFKDGPFTYDCYPDHLPKRGMRIIHTLSGMSYWPGWLTFLDAGWKDFRAEFTGAIDAHFDENPASKIS